MKQKTQDCRQIDRKMHRQTDNKKRVYLLPSPSHLQKFKKLLPVLSSSHLSFKTHGRVYSSCVRSAMLHASETWPLTKPNLQRLQRNDRAMIRQICNVRRQDVVTTRSNELLGRLGVGDLDLILKERRLLWYGHVEHFNGAVDSFSHTG